MMRALVAVGKGRTANKLRAYVRSAYQIAKAAKSKPSIPVAFKAYGIVHNPAAETLPDESANRADKNPLPVEDLRSYWLAIKTMPGFQGAILRLHVLTGGQRIEQLVSLKTENIEASAITLFDGKGRPGKPARPHRVPLTKAAASALKECTPAGHWAISTDGGASHLAATTLSGWAAKAAEVAGIADFKTKRIRSGIETLLAAAGVSLEHRGRLQSHGVSGVQARHYDGHEYLAEKRAALDLLLRQLARRPVAKPSTAARPC
jgi:integrase